MVLYPAGLMIYNSFRKFKPNGFETGAAGWLNYKNALTFPGVPIDRILVNTVVWVVVVVSATVVISLGLAQFLNKAFPGRKLVRLAIIVPWAAIVVMTTTVFFYGLDPYYGIINRFLVDIGMLDAPGYGFTKNPTSAFWVAIGVAIFVSLPVHHLHDPRRAAGGARRRARGRQDGRRRRRSAPTGGWCCRSCARRSRWPP